MQVELALNSIKKHSVRYDVPDNWPDPNPCVKSIYITKVLLSSPPPKTVLVTITLPDEEED